MCAKKNIKFKIIDLSRELFNYHSWATTSLRKIASTLNISDGNLRYHYKTKEEIVLSLFTEMTAKMTEQIQQANREVNGLVSNFKTMFKIMYEYRFLFIESYLIKKTYPSYLVLFNELQEGRKLLFLYEFNRMKEEGILTKRFSSQQYEMFFEQLFIISDTWLHYLDSFELNYVEERIEYYANLCFSLFIPYLVHPSDY